MDRLYINDIPPVSQFRWYCTPYLNGEAFPGLVNAFFKELLSARPLLLRQYATSNNFATTGRINLKIQSVKKRRVCSTIPVTQNNSLGFG